MKKLIYASFTLAIVLLTGSCSKEKNLYDEGKVAEREGASATEIANNVKDIFGVEFDANHDWSMLVSGKVTIKADAALANIVKVQVLTQPPYGNDSAVVLNEAAIKAGEMAELTYDAPAIYDRLFAACVSSEGYYYVKGFKAGTPVTVSFAQAAAARGARAMKKAGAQPNVDELVITGTVESFSKIRTDSANQDIHLTQLYMWKNSGWEVDNLWKMDDATELKLQADAEDFTEDEKDDLQAVFSCYLGVVKGKDNLGKILNTNSFKLYKNYMRTTGGRVEVAPVGMISTEINNCDLYYYYFDPKTIEGMSEEEVVAFLKALPKYRGIHLNNTGKYVNYKNSEVINYKTNVFRRHTYVLPYYGNGKPELGVTKAVSLEFPEGYYVGFMLRKEMGNWKVDYTQPQSGCVYADGRLNDCINKFGHYANAKLQPGHPRAALFSVNGNNYMTFEDGTDRTFNDLILEVHGIIESNDKMNVEDNVYTFAFEDRDLGDYDMNDVVVKAKRIDATHVKYSLEATGANDELYLRNINGQKLNGDTEIHALFGVPQQTFVNTQADGERIQPIQETVIVDEDFSFAKAENQIYIYNKTTNREIRIAAKGQDPHAIMIPWDWKYPLEFICVGGLADKNNVAYKNFNNWGVNPVMATDWYKNPTNGKVYTKSTFK